MSKNTKKKIEWKYYISMAIFLLFCAVCGFLMGMYNDSIGGSMSLKELIIFLIGWVVGLCLAAYVHIIIHEAGHLIFGLLSGYKFSSFRIGSFMWVKENDKIMLKRLSIAGTGGQCLMVPPEMKNGRMPVVLYNLGGSFLNLAFGAIFLLIFFLCAEVPVLSRIILIFAVMGLIYAAMNGIPMRTGTIDNDGYNALALKRNPAAMEALWVQLKVGEQVAKGVRLKDMPAEWFTVPTDDAMKNSLVAARGVFACNRLMDEEKFDEADKLMGHMLEINSGIVGLHRKLTVCDRMFVELITENRKDVLDGMLSKEQMVFMKQMKSFPTVLRTNYAYALLSEKDNEKADKIREQFEKCAKTYPYPSEIQSERELMEIADKKHKII